MHLKKPTRLLAAGLVAALLGAACGSDDKAASDTTSAAAADTTAASASGEAVELTFLTNEGVDTEALANALADAYMAKNPNVKVSVELRPGGADGDNLVKTRLATGEMADVFQYNSGSLLQALDPAKTLVDLSGDPMLDSVVETFLPSVTQAGKVYGVPIGTGMGGGILYNKKVFEANGITVPKTWEEFAANNDKLKAAGVDAVGQSYADTWSSQLFVLADYYNVQAAEPGWDVNYTENKAKFATTPAALAGFEHLQEGFEKGWYNEDFGAATYDEMVLRLAEGKVAQYPMLTFALGNIAQSNAAALADIGFFGQPGTDANNAGATLWMPSGMYIAKTTKHVDEAKKFIAFIASPEGTDVQNKVVPPGGPLFVKGAKLPADVPPAVNDMQAYVDAGKVAPALEFLSPVKGPNLEKITVEVGSGLKDAKAGASSYDDDVAKQAKQLGLAGW